MSRGTLNRVEHPSSVLRTGGRDNYVIACRSYDRAEIFPLKTYRMLEHNGLTDRLYIFVANAQEKAKYEHSLKGLPYKKIVIGELGCAQVVKAICRFFPVGQRIVFMDDDLVRFYCFDAEHKFDRDSNKLGKYLEDAFDTMDKHNLGAFAFNSVQNKFWLKDKPFKEFRPFLMGGYFFACRNDPEMIITHISHNEDVQRTVRFLEKYGGVLVYWWAGFETHYGTEPGGMQTSGNRGEHHEREQKTKDITLKMYDEDELLQAYTQGPKLYPREGLWSFKIKTAPSIWKVMSERGVPLRHARWDSWFHLRPSSQKGLNSI